jgi:hypothetical protein
MPWMKPHSTMAARWPRCLAPRQYRPLTTKLRAWEALVAHHELSCAAGRCREAVEMAGHVRRHDAYGYGDCPLRWKLRHPGVSPRALEKMESA